MCELNFLIFFFSFAGRSGRIAFPHLICGRGGGQWERKMKNVETRKKAKWNMILIGEKNIHKLK